MIFNWFKIFNLTEFVATGLASRSYKVELQGYGTKNILVTKGDYVSVLFDNVFLSLNMNGKNPFSFESRAIYKDEDDNVYVGVQVAD